MLIAIGVRSIRNRVVIGHFLGVGEGRFILFVLLQIIRADYFLPIISEVGEVSDPILIEFEFVEGGYFKRGAFGLAFPSFLNFTFDKLLEMLTQQVYSPLPLNLYREGVDQVHYLTLTHLLLSLYHLRPLSPLFTLRNTRTGEGAVGSRVVTVAFQLALKTFLLLLGDFRLGLT